MQTTRWAVLALMTAAAPGAHAQAAGRLDYPNVNEQVQIAPGESVTLLNRILVDRSPGVRSVHRLEFHYRTSIPAGDEAGRAAQAERAAQHFGASVRQSGVRTVAIAICDTDACARRDEPPRVWYLFDLRAGGVWKQRPN